MLKEGVRSGDSLLAAIGISYARIVFSATLNFPALQEGLFVPISGEMKDTGPVKIEGVTTVVGMLSESRCLLPVLEAGFVFIESRFGPSFC